MIKQPPTVRLLAAKIRNKFKVILSSEEFSLPYNLQDALYTGICERLNMAESVSRIKMTIDESIHAVRNLPTILVSPTHEWNIFNKRQNAAQMLRSHLTTALEQYIADINAHSIDNRSLGQDAQPSADDYGMSNSDVTLINGVAVSYDEDYNPSSPEDIPF